MVHNRAAFSPDGRSLYVGQTARGWGASKGPNTEGMQRITWQGGTPFTIEKMNITPRGFQLTFTAPFNDDALSPGAYTVKSMTYQSKWIYGGEPLDVRPENITRVVAIDDRSVEILIEAFRPRRVYQLHLAGNLRSSTGEDVAFREFHYTANRLPSARP